MPSRSNSHSKVKPISPSPLRSFNIFPQILAFDSQFSLTSFTEHPEGGYYAETDRRKEEIPSPFAGKLERTPSPRSRTKVRFLSLTPTALLNRRCIPIPSHPNLLSPRPKVTEREITHEQINCGFSLLPPFLPPSSLSLSSLVLISRLLEYRPITFTIPVDPSTLSSDPLLLPVKNLKSNKSWLEMMLERERRDN